MQPQSLSLSSELWGESLRWHQKPKLPCFLLNMGIQTMKTICECSLFPFFLKSKHCSHQLNSNSDATQKVTKRTLNKELQRHIICVYILNSHLNSELKLRRRGVSSVSYLHHRKWCIVKLTSQLRTQTQTLRILFRELFHHRKWCIVTCHCGHDHWTPVSQSVEISHTMHPVVLPLIAPRRLRNHNRLQRCRACQLDVGWNDGGSQIVFVLWSSAQKCLMLESLSHKLNSASSTACCSGLNVGRVAATRGGA